MLVSLIGVFLWPRGAAAQSDAAMAEVSAIDRLAYLLHVRLETGERYVGEVEDGCFGIWYLGPQRTAVAILGGLPKVVRLSEGEDNLDCSLSNVREVRILHAVEVIPLRWNVYRVSYRDGQSVILQTARCSAVAASNEGALFQSVSGTTWLWAPRDAPCAITGELQR